MNEFTNNPIDINQLPKFEEVQLKGLHPKYVTVLLFNFSLLLILVIVGFSTLFYFNQDAFPNTIWMAILVGLVFFLAGLGNSKKGAFVPNANIFEGVRAIFVKLKKLKD